MSDHVNGTRVLGTLQPTRAFGDGHLKRTQEDVER
jgi:hypothetical protein